MPVIYGFIGESAVSTVSRRNNETWTSRRAGGDHDTLICTVSHAQSTQYCRVHLQNGTKIIAHSGSFLDADVVKEIHLNTSRNHIDLEA